MNHEEGGDKMKWFKYSLLVCFSFFFLSITVFANDGVSLKQQDYLK